MAVRDGWSRVGIPVGEARSRVGMPVGEAWSRVFWAWFTSSGCYGVGLLAFAGADATKNIHNRKTRLKC